MKLLFVMNPTSGPRENTSTEDLIHEISGNELEIRFHTTTGQNDLQQLKSAIDEFKPDRVSACGGDGTVQLVAQAIMYKPTPLGIIPLGSANGLATALGIPKKIPEAIAAFVNSSRISPLDLLQINDNHICTHLSDIGTNALLVKNYEEAGDKGLIGYAKHLISSIQESDIMQYDITTDEGSCVKEGYMLMIANAHKYGTGVQISEGSVSDGKFEICNVQNIDLESAIKAGLTAINIIIDKDMFKDVISCRQARINVRQQAHLQIDGEYIGEVSEIRVKILSAAINVILPEA